jgi:hypothetical protein
VETGDRVRCGSSAAFLGSSGWCASGGHDDARRSRPSWRLANAVAEQVRCSLRLRWVLPRASASSSVVTPTHGGQQLKANREECPDRIGGLQIRQPEHPDLSQRGGHTRTTPGRDRCRALPGMNTVTWRTRPRYSPHCWLHESHGPVGSPDVEPLTGRSAVASRLKTPASQGTTAGNIIGIPSIPGSYQFTLQVTDQIGATDQANITINAHNCCCATPQSTDSPPPKGAVPGSVARVSPTARNRQG